MSKLISARPKPGKWSIEAAIQAESDGWKSILKSQSSSILKLPDCQIVIAFGIACVSTTVLIIISMRIAAIRQPHRDEGGLE